MVWVYQHQSLVMIGTLALGIGLIMAGPLVGFWVTRRNRLDNASIPSGHGRSAFWDRETHGDLREPKGRALYLADDSTMLWSTRERPATGLPSQQLRPIAVPMPQPELGDAFEAPTVVLETTEPSEAYSGDEKLIAWAGERTEAFSIIDLQDAEEILPETLAERQWMKDPLFSPLYPPDWAEEYAIPKAREAFDVLVQAGALTGIGADLDTEWQDWYDKELVSA